MSFKDAYAAAVEKLSQHYQGLDGAENTEKVIGKAQNILQLEDENIETISWKEASRPTFTFVDFSENYYHHTVRYPEYSVSSLSSGHCSLAQSSIACKRMIGEFC